MNGIIMNLSAKQKQLYHNPEQKKINYYICKQLSYTKYLKMYLA